MDGTDFRLTTCFYMPYCEVFIKSIIAFVTRKVTLQLWFYFDDSWKERIS
jgi:hypothetical protein